MPSSPPGCTTVTRYYSAHQPATSTDSNDCKMQNSFARLVTRQGRRDSGMPLRPELHWLPVRHRVSYKIAELTFKALRVDMSPTYLQQYVQVYTPPRSLRSASTYPLVQNRSHSAAGDCTCVHTAATVWNALPVSVTSKDSLLSFKAALTTHLCASAYTWINRAYISWTMLL